MATNILDVSHLTKTYPGGFKAVDTISFSVKEGEIVGFLGPNGAGKTTTIQMLLGLTTPTSGTIRYFGKEFEKNREYILSHINFASAYSHLQGRITVRQNLKIMAGLYQISNVSQRISELLQLLEVEETANNLFWHLSSGQKTRVVLAKALLNKPKLILMDEPTASLDPDIAEKVIALIRLLQEKEQVAILYTSHNMDEVETICDRVMIMDHGKVVVEDTPLELTKKIGVVRLVVTFDADQSKVSEYLKRKKYIYTYLRKHIVSVEVNEEDIPKVLFEFKKAGIWITKVDIQKPDLEDVFLSIAKGTYEH